MPNQLYCQPPALPEVLLVPQEEPEERGVWSIGFNGPIILLAKVLPHEVVHDSDTLFLRESLSVARDRCCGGSSASCTSATGGIGGATGYLLYFPGL